MGTGEFTGIKRAAFPFLLAAKEDQTIYSPDCVPEGFSLSDPDHLQACNVIALYRHWLERQRQGLTPFIVLNPSPLHGPIIKKSGKEKGKKAVRYLDVSDDPVDEDEEDEDGNGGNDDVGDGDGDVEKAGELKALKIGPPTRKEKTNHAIQAAGPSSLSQSKPAAKGRKPKNSKGGKKTVKTTKETVNDDERQLPENPKRKREAEVGLVGESPLKTQKTDTLRKSGRVAAKTEVDETKKASHIIYDLNTIQLIFFQKGQGQKRPAEDEGGSNPKRPRHQKKDSNPERSGNAAMYVSYPQTIYRSHHCPSAPPRLHLRNVESELG